MEQNWEGDPTLYALEEIIRTLSEQPSQPVASSGHAAESHMPPVELVMPPNINDLLDTALVEVEMGGAATTKYRINGHPELLVRYTEGLTRAEQVLGYRAAQATGLNPIPAEYVTHKGKTYAVTLMIDGAPLDELLTHDPSLEIIEATDQLMTTIAANLQFVHRWGTAWPADAQTPNQFMWGTVMGDDHPRLWLVDLPGTSYTLTDPDEYGIELLTDIGGLQYAEQALGRQLPAARRAFGEAVVRLPDSPRYGDGFRRAAAHCLLNGQNYFEIPGDEYDYIDSFRTY